MKWDLYKGVTMNWIKGPPFHLLLLNISKDFFLENIVEWKYYFDLNERHKNNWHLFFFIWNFKWNRILNSTRWSDFLDCSITLWWRLDFFLFRNLQSLTWRNKCQCEVNLSNNERLLTSKKRRFSNIVNLFINILYWIFFCQILFSISKIFSKKIEKRLSKTWRKQSFFHQLVCLEKRKEFDLFIVFNEF